MSEYLPPFGKQEQVRVNVPYIEGIDYDSLREYVNKEVLKDNLKAVKVKNPTSMSKSDFLVEVRESQGTAKVVDEGGFWNALNNTFGVKTPTTIKEMLKEPYTINSNLTDGGKIIKGVIKNELDYTSNTVNDAMGSAGESVKNFFSGESWKLFGLTVGSYIFLLVVIIIIIMRLVKGGQSFGE